MGFWVEEEETAKHGPSQRNVLSKEICASTIDREAPESESAEAGEQIDHRMFMTSHVIPLTYRER